MGALVVWDGLFSPSELDAIVAHGDAMRLAEAQVANRDGSGYNAVRVTRVGWFERPAAPEWIFSRLEDAVLRLNSQFFRYDLSALLNPQYAVYDAGEKGHFDWHQDYGRDATDPSREPRKLTISVQLSEADAYDGCEFQAQGSHTVDIAPRTRGTLIAFPSYVLHRVTPATRGQRKSLVGWAVGPDLR
ncbi:MAG: hypothetical protein BGN82_11610 [Alphaproteobacteria bacterium 65-7]|nr:MAG: hypothetical protein BGN82_11610 [Alphaproteobacteria bacterium 65-7]